MDEKQRAEEALVVLRCQLGERDAFRELVARWQDPLHNFVRHMADGDQATEDIVQTVWLKVVRGLPRLRDPRAFPAWAFAIARRSVVDRYRYDRSDEQELTHDPPADDCTEATMSQLVVGEAVAALPPFEREAVELHYLADLTIDDVASVVGVPPGTVKSRLARARRLLAPDLEPLIEGETDE